MHGDRTREFGAADGYGLIEFAYATMARAAGIEMADCRLYVEGGRHHFMTRRFDRPTSSTKLHMSSLAGMDHADFNAAGSYSYEEAVTVMRRLGLHPDAVAQQYRRAVFNVVARNQDDHVKNIAFLMDKSGQWSLSPAYDVTVAYDPAGRWTALHQMSLNGRRTDFATEDLVEFAAFCNIKAAPARRVIGDVVESVRDWPDHAAAAGVAGNVSQQIASHHRLEFD